MVEREALASPHYEWLEEVSPKDVIEVLLDPKSEAPRLFLRVKYSDAPPEAPEEVSDIRGGCLGLGCLNYVFMLGLGISMLLITAAIIGIALVLLKPGGTAEGRQAVMSMSLWLLLAGLVGALLFVVPFLVLVYVVQRKR